MRQPKDRPIINLESTGKVPPQAVEVEQAVLGAFMLESDSYMMNPVNPEVFYKSEHVTICTVIQEMTREKKQIDLLTVTRKLHEKGLIEEIGGPLYITQLTSRIASVAHLNDHILILKDKYLRREMIRMSAELQSGAFDESVDLSEIIESAQSIFMKLLGDETESVRSFTEVAKEVEETVIKNSTLQIPSTGIPTGFKKFDDFAHGMQAGDLVIIAGESSHGKTTLALNIINNAAKMGYSCNVRSLEMTSKLLVSRIIAIESGISSKDILFQRLGIESVQHITSHISKLNGLPVYFDDKSTASIHKICASVRKMVLKYSVKLVVVDYLQLVTGDAKQGREEEVGQNARILKNLAMELNVVIVALSQLNRTESHIPTLSRLRASGQIGEAADLVLLVWIPEKENITFIKREDGTEENMNGKAGIIVAKGRNVGTMDFSVNSDRRINRMWDIEPEPFTPLNRDYTESSINELKF